MGRGSSLHGDEKCVKTFFITEEFTKFDLALNAVSENHSKVEKSAFMMFH